MLPIDIVNQILVYVGELNHALMITQYDTVTHQPYPVINFHSSVLWRIQSSLMMKRIYPIPTCDFSNKGNIELYRFGIPHYETQLRDQS